MVFVGGGEEIEAEGPLRSCCSLRGEVGGLGS